MSPNNNADDLQKANKYDRHEAWNDHCKPLLDELVKNCHLYQIPFFATACVANDASGSEYISDAVGPVAEDLYLKDDKISRHLAVSRGYDVRPPRDEVIVEMDEVLFD